MKKNIVYILILALMFNVFVPCQQVYATTTETSNDDSMLVELLKDAVQSIADAGGYVIDSLTGVVGDILDDFTIHVGDYSDYLPQYLEYDFSTRQLTLEPTLYEIVLRIIEEHASQKVNISDYIYKYYPDRAISDVRVPIKSENNATVNAWITNSYNHIMNITGSEGENVVNTLTAHKYYWMSYACMGADASTDEQGNAVYGARYAYIDSNYEDSVIFIKSGNNSYNMYQYNKSYQTFSTVPMNYIVYCYDAPSSVTAFDVTETGKYVTGTAIFQGGNMSSANAYANYMWSGLYPFFCGSADSDFPTLGSPFSYFGTVRFPIWQSQEKYVEYMTLFPNYNPEQNITHNEDNSVTINNYYTPDSGDDSDIDYTDALEQIRQQVSGILIAFNLFTEHLYRELDAEIGWLEKIYDRMGNQYDMLEKIYNKITNGGASDLSEVIEYLKKINNKLLCSNIFDAINDILDWVEELKDDTLSTAMESLAEVMTQAFPFSLLADIVLITGLFVAEPVTPCFTIPLDFTVMNLNCKYDLVIDLAPFQLFADIVKAFLILLWIIGLLKFTFVIMGNGGGE